MPELYESKGKQNYTEGVVFECLSVPVRGLVSEMRLDPLPVFSSLAAVQVE